MIIGITFSSIYQKEYNFNITVGEEVTLDNEILKFRDIQIIEEKNYQSLVAIFSLEREEGIIGLVKPGKNYYPVSKTIPTEAGIYHDWFKDFYVVLGNEKDNVWSAKLYFNPLVNFIWLGVVLMVFSGLMGIRNK